MQNRDPRILWKNYVQNLCLLTMGKSGCAFYTHFSTRIFTRAWLAWKRSTFYQSFVIFLANSKHGLTHLFYYLHLAPSFFFFFLSHIVVGGKLATKECACVLNGGVILFSVMDGGFYRSITGACLSKKLEIAPWAAIIWWKTCSCFV